MRQHWTWLSRFENVSGPILPIETVMSRLNHIWPARILTIAVSHCFSCSGLTSPSCARGTDCLSRYCWFHNGDHSVHPTSWFILFCDDDQRLDPIACDFVAAGTILGVRITGSAFIRVLVITSPYSLRISSLVIVVSIDRTRLIDPISQHATSKKNMSVTFHNLKLNIVLPSTKYK